MSPEYTIQFSNEYFHIITILGEWIKRKSDKSLNLYLLQ